MAPRIEKATRRQFPNGIRGYGTDALRFTFAALATQGRDVVFDLGRIEGYRNFCNKLWNASRFVLMNTEGKDTGLDPVAPFSLGLAERWILSRLQRTVQAVNEAIEEYRFDVATQRLYEFVWNEYCDWYVELAKATLTGTESEAAVHRGTRRTLVRVLESTLRLAHPFMPFLSEEIWQRVAPLAGAEGDTVMRANYPQAEAEQVDDAAEAEMQWLQRFVLGPRKIRAEMNISPGKHLEVLLQGGDAEDRARYERNAALATSLARVTVSDWLDVDADAPESATALVGSMKLLIPMKDLIDKEAEAARLEKETSKAASELSRGESKLANEQFVGRAPPAVVDGERQRVAELRDALTQLQAQLERIRTL
jgi:valyl-tRNA synthetase